MSPRRGTIIILVAGMSALLAAMALAFLARMRGDAEEMGVCAREAQARIMLVAGCHYVQEASRLGYQPRAASLAARTVAHREGFGWIDVRDGATGPRDQARANLFSTALVEDSDGDRAPDRPAWPAIGGVVRAPMQVRERPPFAIGLANGCNPMSSDEASPDFGMPYLTRPDPLPTIENTGAAAEAAWWTGDPRPRSTSTGLAWFRCYRDGDATFVITCGAGGSLGFRDWGEVVGANAEPEFLSDRATFERIVDDEVRLWYRVEWSAASQDATYHGLENDLGRDVYENYIHYSVNSSHTTPFSCSRSRSYPCNPVGTIRWVQRLLGPPTKW